MKSRAVDERESSAEVVAECYWVWLFTRDSSQADLCPENTTSWACDVRELTECDVEDAVAFGREQVGGETFAVAVARRTPAGVSLTWVRGCDLNGEPLDPSEARGRRRMLDGSAQRD